MMLELSCEGRLMKIQVEETAQGSVVNVDGNVFSLRLIGREGNLLRFDVNGKEVLVEYLEESTNSVVVELFGTRLEYMKGLGSTQTGHPSTSGVILKSPLPGRILEVKVSANQLVRPGDPLLIMESMKMETVLRADREAVVSSILVKKGDSIKKGQALLAYE